MEPVLPPEANETLAELGKQIFLHAGRLSAQVPAEKTQRQIAEVVRMMNSYYSNLIEGHRTYPLDIEKALKNDFSGSREARQNQLLSVAHIGVEQLLEKRISEESTNPFSKAFLCWIHEDFYSRLPGDLRVSYTKSGKAFEIIPGEIRTFNVDVGRHKPVDFRDVPKFLGVFEERYSSQKTLPVNRLAAIAASHHRLAWIHPFGDGNGRVARLFSHALLLREGIGGCGLWTLSRGLARGKSDYFAHLNNADLQRINDLDGRGNLSERYLVEFCEFFLRTILDQIQFMEKTLRLTELESGIAYYVSRVERIFGKDEERGRRLLIAALYHGEVRRGEVAAITSKGETTARKILQRGLDAGLLVSETPKAPVRLAFPAKVLTHYFPGLYVE